MRAGRMDFAKRDGAEKRLTGKLVGVQIQVVSGGINACKLTQDGRVDFDKKQLLRGVS